MEIIDIIYGKFSIPKDVAAIVATAQFQRLKLIKQLGLLRINDCIEHNHHRYAHCLGTYFAASLMLNALEKNTDWLKDNTHKIPLVYRKAIQIAALLHDIAHGPFSHAWEHVVKNYTHEKEACSSIDQIFQQLNEEEFPELRKNDNFGIELIKALIEGDIEHFKFKSKLPKRFYFIFEIVSNKRFKLDVDKWDYLKRDAYYLNHLTQPNMDFDDVFLRARVSACGSCIEYRYEDYHKIYNIFLARYKFHLKCYTLPEFLLNDYILNLAIKETEPKINNALITDITANMMPEFLQMTDDHVLKLIKNSVLSKFLQYDTKFEKVDQIECKTTSATVNVTSVSQYMPNKQLINFYGDIKRQSVINDQTKVVKKVYSCYCDQSTKTVYYTVQQV